MARILVTGGAGFIGSHLCDRLAADPTNEIVVIDDLSTGRLENLSAPRSRIRFIEDSVANISRHADQLRDVTRIYHLAALISSQDSLKEPKAYVDTNINGLLSLLAVCRQLQRPRIVFASSSTVYGASEGTVRRESDPARPITMYALSKYASEHILAMYQPLLGYDYVCLRLFNVYGPRQSPHHPYANVTCKFAEAAARGSSVRLYGDGAQSRDFVYVDDVVDAFLRLSSPTTNHIYNVGTGRDVTIGALLGLVETVGGRKLVVERCPPWPNDIRAIRADIARLRQDAGFEPRVSLADGLRKTIEFFRDGRA
jgi:UDP-glucose 4-epimerase